MCGRLNISDFEGVRWLMAQLDLSLEPDRFSPNFNVAPTRPLWGATKWQHEISLQPMAWGFVPPWAKEGQFEKPLINARSETIWEKSSFKSLIRRYRGIVFANGFYEWKREGKERTPFYVSLKDAPAMALATVVQEHGDGYMQCAIVTTQANSDMAQVHHRQPVIVEASAMTEWLGDDTRKEKLNAIMRPMAPGRLDLRQVSREVNSTRHNGPECLAPPAAPKPRQVTFDF